MEKFLLGLLIFSGIFFIIQTLLGFLGGDADLDVPDDIGSPDGIGLMEYLSVRNIATFLLGFSSAGYLVLKSTGSSFFATLSGLIFGVVLAGSVILIMKLFMRFEQHNKAHAYEYRGLHGVVTVAVPAGNVGLGKVEITIHGRMDEMLAVTDEEESLAKGAHVTVVSLLDNGHLLVKKTLLL